MKTLATNGKEENGVGNEENDSSGGGGELSMKSSKVSIWPRLNGPVSRLALIVCSAGL